MVLAPIAVILGIWLLPVPDRLGLPMAGAIMFAISLAPGLVVAAAAASGLDRVGRASPLAWGLAAFIGVLVGSWVTWWVIDHPVGLPGAGAIVAVAGGWLAAAGPRRARVPASIVVVAGVVLALLSAIDLFVA